MTKSRQSAIKLRLSRLIRCLLALGCLKLAIMGVALLDLPMPAWLGAGTGSEVAEKAAPVQEYSAPVSQETVEVATLDTDEAMPQGAAAAELAAAAKPRRSPDSVQAALPAPLVQAGPASQLRNQAGLITPLLPEPPALDAPLVAAGVILPDRGEKSAPPQEDSTWNMLDLKSLPIPVLGSAQIAHAATIDMPVPNTPGQASPFVPAAQARAGSAQVLPGAPPLPANIPNGQGADGSPLPLRQDGNFATQTGMLPPLPQSGATFDAPAPNIPQRVPASLDHNAKSQELARQQQDMLMLRQQMDQRLKELQTAEDKIKDALREAKDNDDKKVKSLVQMYANMKPRMAAQALENMDERVAVRILSGMAPKQSGEILTYTNPAKTAKFTEMITRLRLGE